MAYRPQLLPIVLALAAAATAAHAEIVISTAQTQNVTCSAGVCSPTATDAVLNTTDLENLLAAGNVEVTTTGADIEARDIQIAAALGWSGSFTLTLQADRSIAIDAAVAVGGPGGLTLASSAGKTGGEITYSGGNITFADLASRLVINGKKFKLVDDIATLAQYFTTKPSGHAALANNYDASGDGTYTSSPVGTIYGIFDGLGNTISNLSIDDTSDGANIGLFSEIGTGGKARDIAIANANVSSSGEDGSAGVLAASVAGIVSGCSTSGTVAAQFTAGGLAADSYGTISRCTSSATVSGMYAGGLVGSSEGTIRLSSATGATSGVYGAGGLAGTTGGGSLIEDSHATGSVAVSAGSAGGLVGSNQGWLSDTYATDSVIVGESSQGGGLVGTDDDTAKITDSFATGSVSGGSSAIGALVGVETGSIENSYATGAVTGQDSTVGGFASYCEGRIRHSYSIGAVDRHKTEYAGGFAGEDYSSGGIGGAYWDITTSGERKGTGNRGNEPGLKGETTAKLQAGLPKGFSKGVWAEDPSINNGFPYLIHNPPPN